MTATMYETSAKVIADSISESGFRLTTFQLTFPRFILSQFSKHRRFSFNTASSRAIPTAKLIEQVRTNPVIPVSWGKNRAGMVADGTLNEEDSARTKEIWLEAANYAANKAEEMAELGVHKEVVNRILEPFTWTHVVVTSTGYGNFFNLRLASDAQPDIQLLAQKMKAARDASTPQPVQFHLPYITEEDYAEYGELNMATYHDVYAPISAARVARVSYNKHDGSRPSFEEDMRLATRLRESGHWTCFESQAISMGGYGLSANFVGWEQYRQSLDDFLEEDMKTYWEAYYAYYGDEDNSEEIPEWEDEEYYDDNANEGVIA